MSYDDHPFCVDVSRWQGIIDWAALAGHIDGAWIKVGGADDGLYADGQAARNTATCPKPWGTYYFAQPGGPPAATQARHAVDNGYGRGQLWPALDMEVNPSRLSVDALDEFVREFCAAAMGFMGRDSMVYTGASFGVGHSVRPPTCPLWIANYGTNHPGVRPGDWTPDLPPAWGDWSVWQHNSVTVLPGVASPTVDANIVRPAFWAAMTGTVDDDQEDDDMGTAIARTRIGSPWALQVMGRDDISHIFDCWGIWARQLPSPDVAAARVYLGAKDLGELDDAWFWGLTVVPWDRVH